MSWSDDEPVADGAVCKSLQDNLFLTRMCACGGKNVMILNIVKDAAVDPFTSGLEFDVAKGDDILSTPFDLSEFFQYPQDFWYI